MPHPERFLYRNHNVPTSLADQPPLVCSAGILAVMALANVTRALLA